MRRHRRSGALWLAVAIMAGAAAPGAAAADCSIPADLAAVEVRLPALRARIEARRPVRIVAIGGGSTAGAAAGAADLAYPRRLQQQLTRWYAPVPITVVNKGVARQSAQQMLQRFDRDVFAEHPALVIWEAGINDAVHGVDIDDFAGALQRGIDRLKAHGIEVILIDIQFSRTTETLIDFARYQNALHQAGEFDGVYVFPRYEIMRYWSEQHVFDFDTVDKGERAKLAANVYRCIGDRLADAIRRAIR